MKDKIFDQPKTSGPPMQQMVQPMVQMMPVRPAPPMLVPQPPMFIPQVNPQGGPPGPQQQMFMQQQQRPGGVLGGGPPGQRMGGPGGMPPVPPMGGGGGEEPPMKRQKTEDNLIPEDRFIRQNPGRVNFTVRIFTCLFNIAYLRDKEKLHLYMFKRLSSHDILNMY